MNYLFEPHSYTKEFNCQAAYSNLRKRWTSYEGILYSTISKLTCGDEISWKHCYFDDAMIIGFEKKRYEGEMDDNARPLG